MASSAERTSVALVAGEASGDLLGGLLLEGLRPALPEARFWGVGGEAMRTQGFEARWSYEPLAVHGFVDALRRYPQLVRFRRELARAFESPPVDLFIGIDAPDFNLGLEARLKRAGIGTVHFVSPSIWAWRRGRLKTIARAVDLMLCLFPFEPPLYAETGVEACFVGHPLADRLPLVPDQAGVRTALGIAPQAPVLALLPGSREGELRHLLPVFLAAAARLRQALPELVLLLPTANALGDALVAAALAEVPELEARVLPRRAHEAMTAADVVLLASGTAALEAALLKRPMVIAYRMNPWQYRLLRRMAYLPWVGLPNILLRETVVPELLQDEANPADLAAAVLRWFEDAPARERLAERFTELHLMLRQDTARRAREAILARFGPRLGGR
ncbi:lipid-A-disaccharide synthase [Tepidiphilus sp. J10]|uniref:lipid-A-disaccharide synthase n=1 Tax=Tepidiphilus sp. J10 TaxID=2502185 RepID=UPI00115EF338|nr:lipid-A-disaccharide synthase [Tepidiphilus sp. J10]